ncbi:MAG: dienelactone hydrolase family protein [Pirellulales bacterium]
MGEHRHIKAGAVGANCRRRCLLILTATAIMAAVGERCAQAVDLSYGQTGAYTVGNRQVSVARSAGGSGTFNALVYYPATTAGSNTPLDLSGGAYPVVSFAHGYTSVVSTNYTATLAQMASHGYIVIAPQSYESILDVFETEDLGHDQTSAYNYLASQSGNAGSPFYQGVQATGYAAIGHSMGGAASISEASQNPSVKTVATWAAQNMVIPSAPVQVIQVHEPMLMIAASEDNVVSASTTNTIYNNGNPPKGLNILNGATHLGFYDSGPTWQLEYSRALSVAWFELYMKGDQSVWRDFWGPEAVSNALIQNTHHSGISLTATLASLTGSEGTTAQFSLKVQNIGTTPTSYSLFVDDNEYSTDLSMLQTPVLNVGQFASFTVDVDRPHDAPLGAFDTLLVSARSDLDGGTRNFVTLTANVIQRAPGDANNDGVADGLDYVAWSDHFGQSTANGHNDGDFNVDGVVDGLDYTIWADNYSAAAAGGGGEFAALVVPEPASWSLGICGFLSVAGLAVCQRRRRQFSDSKRANSGA